MTELFVQIGILVLSRDDSLDEARLVDKSVMNTELISILEEVVLESSRVKSSFLVAR